MRIYLITIILLTLASCTRYPSNIVETDYGALYHKQSGIIFPESIDDFKRGVVIVNYDDSDNLTVDYNHSDTSRPAIVTLYLYKQSVAGTTTTLSEEYEDMLKTTKRIFPYATVYKEEDTNILVDGTEIEVKSIVLEYLGYPNMNKKAHYYLFLHKEWFLKFIVVYRNHLPMEKMKLTNEVLNKLKLPNKSPVVNLESIFDEE